MSALVKPTTPIDDEGPKVITLKFDKQKCIDHIQSILDKLSPYQGKKNHNPFLWVKKHITPLTDRINGYVDAQGHKHEPETSESLQRDVLSLEFKEPKVVFGQEPEQEKPQQQLKISPQGTVVIEQKKK